MAHDFISFLDLLCSNQDESLHVLDSLDAMLQESVFEFRDPLHKDKGDTIVELNKEVCGL